MRDEAVETGRGDPATLCLACSHELRPDFRSTGPWECENCGKKHPNLKMHWRLMAAACGGVPLLVWAIGIVGAVVLGSDTAASTPIAQWLGAPSALVTSATDGLKLAALFGTFNA